MSSGPPERNTSGSSVPAHTGSTGTRVLGSLVLLGGAFTILSGLWWSAPDDELGDRIRPLYVHVPTVTAAYCCFILGALGSLLWLWRRSEFWDKVAVSATEVGVVFIGLTLVTGSLWGEVAWGTWWEWDARLTSTLVMFLVYVGYLVLRASLPDPVQRATRSAVVGMAAIVLIPLVHKSVEWWRTIHQTETIMGTTDAKIEGLQLFTLMAGLFTGLFLAAFLVIHRFRVEVLTSRAAEAQLSDAIAERRNEAVGAGV